MKMPIVDLSDNPVTMGQIDWNQPQPPGTYRCVEGWESDGYQFGCLHRATTETDDAQLRCTEHALLYEIRALRHATQTETVDGNENAEQLGEYLCNIDHQLDVTAEALWDINYTLMPTYRKIWYRVRRWWTNRRGPQPPTQAQLNEAKSCKFCWPKPCTPEKHAKLDEVMGGPVHRDTDQCQCSDCKAQSYIEGSDAPEMMGGPEMMPEQDLRGLD